ncbi:hypothetical protein PGQ11_009947 [Apiospora arundinis]|uniref:Uncharacterized protein n=1 Tax=Apiospora arundinis TaxID=335852 RepID=A0ABR2I8Z5_9PEZI
MDIVTFGDSGCAPSPKQPKPKPPKPDNDDASSAEQIDGAYREYLGTLTCPCGYGYYNDQEAWIPGNLVRAGKAPTREGVFLVQSPDSEGEDSSPQDDKAE